MNEITKEVFKALTDNDVKEVKAGWNAENSYGSESVFLVVNEKTVAEIYDDSTRMKLCLNDALVATLSDVYKDYLETVLTGYGVTKYRYHKGWNLKHEFLFEYKGGKKGKSEEVAKEFAYMATMIALDAFVKCEAQYFIDTDHEITENEVFTVTCEEAKAV